MKKVLCARSPEAREIGRRWGWEGTYLAEVQRTPGFTTELVGTSIALSCRTDGGR